MTVVGFVGLGNMGSALAGNYLDEVRGTGGPASVGSVVQALWERLAADEPGADFTRIHP